MKFKRSVAFGILSFAIAAGSAQAGTFSVQSVTKTGTANLSGSSSTYHYSFDASVADKHGILTGGFESGISNGSLGLGMQPIGVFEFVLNYDGTGLGSSFLANVIWKTSGSADTYNDADASAGSPGWFASSVLQVVLGYATCPGATAVANASNPIVNQSSLFSDYVGTGLSRIRFYLQPDGTYRATVSMDLKFEISNGLTAYEGSAANGRGVYSGILYVDKINGQSIGP